jgi:propionyl-CoA carboxylase alpha chain
MLQKVLVANRGEIAVRILKTLRRMGIASVAVFSDADAGAPYVEMADEARHIGPAPATESYLSIARILEACKASGADSIHPGYGFLSERADFARAVAAENIVFIGPNPAAIEAMGDKIRSKALARAAGVSIIPGHLEALADADEALKIAETIGFPVMLKASAGGGGKGMRTVASASEIAEAFARATSEAGAAFGDGRIFVEKIIDEPRHIEIQVLGDKHGNLVHLGERECSIQRRHQKVVEEAPSPFVDEALRLEMGRQALELARAVGYDCAGTVEFIVAPDKSFYFLEMNTRLQVEHPVTELVTGLDLVEQMIRVASGERLAIAQADVHIRGAAVETRIYAEDPTRDFLPSIGRLETYEPPPVGHSDGVTLRIDSGVTEGSEISVFYDPMIAKLVTHAEDRARAIEAQARGLDAFVIDGIRHNIGFLSALMQNPKWRSGNLSTSFIAREFPAGFASSTPDAQIAHRLAAVAALADHIVETRRRSISGQIRRGSQAGRDHERAVMLDRSRYDVSTEDTATGFLVRFEKSGESLLCRSDWHPGRVLWRGTIDGEASCVQIHPILNGFVLTYRGFRVEARVYSRREAALAALMPQKTPLAGGRRLLCPMPGLVRAIHVVIGQELKSGEPLCTVEAMKMENVLRAEYDAIVKAIHAKVGDSLSIDTVIMEFARSSPTT